MDNVHQDRNRSFNCLLLSRFYEGGLRLRKLMNCAICRLRTTVSVIYRLRRQSAGCPGNLKSAVCAAQSADCANPPIARNIFITLLTNVITSVPAITRCLITVTLTSFSVHSLHRSLSVSLRIVYCYLAVVLGDVHASLCVLLYLPLNPCFCFHLEDTSNCYVLVRTL